MSEELSLRLSEFLAEEAEKAEKAEKYVFPDSMRRVPRKLSFQQKYQCEEQEMRVGEDILRELHPELILNPVKEYRKLFDEEAPCYFYQVPIGSYLIVNPNQKKHPDYWKFTKFCGDLRAIIGHIKDKPTKKPTIVFGSINYSGLHYLPFFIHCNTKSKRVSVITIDPAASLNDQHCPKSANIDMMRSAFQHIFKECDYDDPNVTMQLGDYDCGFHCLETQELALKSAKTANPLFSFNEEGFQLNIEVLTRNGNKNRVFDPYSECYKYSPIVVEESEQTREKWAERFRSYSAEYNGKITALVRESEQGFFLDDSEVLMVLEHGYDYDDNVEKQDLPKVLLKHLQFFETFVMEISEVKQYFKIFHTNFSIINAGKFNHIVELFLNKVESSNDEKGIPEACGDILAFKFEEGADLKIKRFVFSIISKQVRKLMPEALMQAFKKHYEKFLHGKIVAQDVFKSFINTKPYGRHCLRLSSYERKLLLDRFHHHTLGGDEVGSKKLVIEDEEVRREHVDLSKERQAKNTFDTTSKFLFKNLRYIDDKGVSLIKFSSVNDKDKMESEDAALMVEKVILDVVKRYPKHVKLMGYVAIGGKKLNQRGEDFAVKAQAELLRSIENFKKEYESCQAVISGLLRIVSYVNFEIKCQIISVLVESEISVKLSDIIGELIKIEQEVDKALRSPKSHEGKWGDSKLRITEITRSFCALLLEYKVVLSKINPELIQKASELWSELVIVIRENVKISEKEIPTIKISKNLACTPKMLTAIAELYGPSLTLPQLQDLLLFAELFDKNKELTLFSKSQIEGCLKNSDEGPSEATKKVLSQVDSLKEELDEDDPLSIKQLMSILDGKRPQVTCSALLVIYQLYIGQIEIIQLDKPRVIPYLKPKDAEAGWSKRVSNSKSHYISVVNKILKVHKNNLQKPLTIYGCQFLEKEILATEWQKLSSEAKPFFFNTREFFSKNKKEHTPPLSLAYCSQEATPRNYFFMALARLVSKAYRNQGIYKTAYQLLMPGVFRHTEIPKFIVLDENARSRTIDQIPMQNFVYLPQYAFDVTWLTSEDGQELLKNPYTGEAFTEEEKEQLKSQHEALSEVISKAFMK